MSIELMTIAVAMVLSALSEAALGVLAASLFRDDCGPDEKRCAER